MKKLFLVVLLFSNLANAQDAEELSVEEKLQAAATEHRSALHYEDGVFSGPAWDLLVEEGRAAKFFLIGEEHGIAENPLLAGQLFATLTDYGYSKFVIEISPTMAEVLDDAAKDGLDGLRSMFSRPGGEPAFFGKQEEAEMVATIRAALPEQELVFWGTDYEVLSDRELRRILAETEKPEAAEEAFQVLQTAADGMWDQFMETRSPQYIFSFGGDPALVRAVIDAWPDADAETRRILHTLEETLIINNLWMQGKAWDSNKRRANLQRHNFIEYWAAATAAGESPRLIAKFGGSHLVRGLSQTAVFDLGVLLPEIAALEGETAVSMLVVPGAGTEKAAFNPTTFGFDNVPASGGYLKGLGPIADAAFADEFTVIDLRPLRAIAGMKRRDLDDELFRVIHGFDLLLVMSGSTPSGELEHD